MMNVTFFGSVSSLERYLFLGYLQIAAVDMV